MLDTITSLLDEFRRNFRWVDAVDIFLIALLLYWALIWFGETASRRMLTGVTLLALVYLAARMFDMTMTSLVFHTGFTVLLILLIVIFQEDLRRMVSRSASWLTLSRVTEDHRADDELEQLAESAFDLAQRNIGALFVLPGAEPLERHLHGGVKLGGRISEQLIDSIFDPSSQGHDGAVIVDGPQIASFGVHLPITPNAAAVHGRGTRHSAAVGISERSDALVIVVSEERGDVSLAQQGQLRRIKTPAQLLESLQEFRTRHPIGDRSMTLAQHLTKHWRLKTLAASLALIGWFLLAYNPNRVLRTVVAPIEYRNLPTGLVLDEPAADEARVTLSGTESSFRFLSPESLRVSVDLSNRKPGSHTVELGPENVQLPANMEIENIAPNVLWLYLKEQQPKPVGGVGGT